MSLFPAYDKTDTPSTSAQANAGARRVDEKESTASSWWCNESFAPLKIKDAALTSKLESEPQVRAYSPYSTSICTDTDTDSCSSPIHKLIAKDTSRYEKKYEKQGDLLSRPLEFDIMDEFCVDKDSNVHYHGFKRLPNYIRPQYSVLYKRVLNPAGKHIPKYSRRSSQKIWRDLMKKDMALQMSKLSDEEISSMRNRIKELRNLLAKTPTSVENWVSLHELLGKNLEKLSRLALTDHQLHCLEDAMNHNPSNKILINLYVRTASAAYTTDEVATKLNQMLEKDPYDYNMWSALIMNSQANMSQCNITDVLAIYQNCMRRMYLGRRDKRSSKRESPLTTEIDTDILMIKLLNNCLLLMQQSANCGLAFALLKMSLEQNIAGSNFDCFQANLDDESPLLEYEELVLNSGLPMPEIWTRIERLRQAYLFLPYPQMNHTPDEALAAGLDPQRCIYSEDVCHFMYPLRTSKHLLHLMLLAVQQTKMPISRTNCLSVRLAARIDDQMGESDAIEFMLAHLTDRSTYALPFSMTSEYNDALVNLVKEMSVGPTFIPQTLGCELGAKCVSSLLTTCIDALTQPEDETKRHIFVVLFFRFERLRMNLYKLTNKLTDKYLSEARRRMRNLLAKESHRSEVRFYTELAMFEFEVLNSEKNEEAAFRILRNIITAQAESLAATDDVQLMHAYIIYAEMLIARNQHDMARHILACLLLGRHATMPMTETIRQQKHALEHNERRVTEELHTIHAEISMPMSLENYFIPQKFLLLVKGRSLLLCLLGQAVQANALLERLLHKEFSHEFSYERCLYMREHLYELQLLVVQLPMPVALAARRSCFSLERMLGSALVEFPRNLTLLQSWISLGTLPWYKLRARLVNIKAGILSIVHMILACRLRFVIVMAQQGEGQDVTGLESTVRLRLRAIFNTFLPTNQQRSVVEAEQYEVLRRNPLFWRFHLRCNSDEYTSFECGEKCLFMGLDECPWAKALYMDGCIHVPSVLARMQDVMTEKEIRIYAIPEELDVLRN